MKPMNVAIFASAFYPHVGGVEELVRQLSHTYQARGVSPVIITNRWPRSLPSFEEYEGIPTYRLALRTPEASLKSKVSYTLTHNAVKRSVADILRDHDIDVMHVQCVSCNGYYALLAKRQTGLPLVVTAQGERTMDATGLYQRSKFMNDVLRALLEEADRITGCSRATLLDLEQYFGKPFGDRARVVLNGISLDDFDGVDPYQHPRPYVLGIGRMVRQKGFDVLLRAFADAGLAGHDLLLAGDGAERAELEQLSASLGLAERVQFLGRADRRLAVRLFKGCAWFVLPSRHEPLGIVNLEAMAAGKAVVASDTGGVPEVVADGETGILVAPEDVAALSQAMSELAADPKRLKRLGAAGAARVREFTWAAIADQYLDLYSQAVAASTTATIGAGP
jgi:glycogen(starch) synthase